ncbi:hypothetical protein KY348_05060 [Candidatus Woesearchaeota archaeon]|nr:hypothetical protein [Candidatus Woesearchaeota archaeon]
MKSLLECQEIHLSQLKKHFKIEKQSDLFKLKYKNSINAILIRIPFKLDEQVASLAGLMPDGSLIKDLRRIYFHQKKDDSKITLFKDLIISLFSPNNKIFVTKDRGTLKSYINSTTLAMFFYKILKIPKSDEQMRVPAWIFNSPKRVKIAYLREAFAMEGTILKKLTEIRLITKDKDFAIDLQRLLAQIGISSFVKPRIGGIRRTLQYRLSIYGKENFVLFKEIGFSTEFHKGRFERLCSKYGI